MSEGNVFEGEPDARQKDDTVTSRFRPRYRKLTESEIALHDAIKEKAAELESLIEQIGTGCYTGRYIALSITALEESVIWAVKQLTS